MRQLYGPSVRQKPGPGAQIDWANPDAEALADAWLFTEQAGSATRSAVSGALATITAPSWVVGAVGGGDPTDGPALEFNGSPVQTLATAPTPAFLKVGFTTLTIELRFQTRDFGGLNTVHEFTRCGNAFIFRHNNSFTGGQQIEAYVTAAGSLRHTSMNNVAAIALGKWNTAHFVWDGNAGHLYLNGIEAANGYAAQQTGGGLIQDTSSLLCFGASDNGSEGWAGRMGRAIYWTRALTQQQIQARLIRPYSFILPILPQRIFLGVQPPAIHVYTPSGGMAFGGTARHHKLPYQASGGMAFGGSAAVIHRNRGGAGPIRLSQGRTGIQKPPAGSTIDDGHPDAAALADCWLFDERAGTLTNAKRGNNRAAITNAPWKTGPDGASFLDFTANPTGSTATSYAHASPSHALDGATAATWEMRFLTKAHALVNNDLTLVRNDGQANVQIFNGFASGEGFKLGVWIGGTLYQPFSGDLGFNGWPLNTWHTCHITWDGQTFTSYLDGKVQSMGATTPAGQSIVNAVSDLWFAAIDNTTAAESAPIQIERFITWRRCYTAAEIKRRNAQPYAFLNRQGARSVWLLTPPPAVHAYTPSGGMAFGGAATTTGGRPHVYTPSGGMAFGGHASTLRVSGRYTYRPSGGMAFGGTAQVQTSPQQYTYRPLGGMAFGGHALAARFPAEYVYTPSGGMAFGGHAPSSRPGGAYPASGGMAFGGHAPSRMQYTITVYWPIFSSERWGVPTIGRLRTIAPTAIPSSEAWGRPSLEPVLYPTAIPSSEAWGRPTISGGTPTIMPKAIPSSEAWGVPTLNRTIEPGAIPSSEDWTKPTILQAVPVISPRAITDPESFGTPLVINSSIAYPIGNPPPIPIPPDPPWPTHQPEPPPPPVIYTPAYSGYSYDISDYALSAVWHKSLAAGEDTFTVVMPANAPGAGFGIGGTIGFGGAPYGWRIFKVESSGSEAQETVSATGGAPHYALGKIPAPPLKSISITGRKAMECALKNADGWHVGDAPDEEKVIADPRCKTWKGLQISWQHQSALGALNQIQQAYGGFLWFDENGHTVNISDTFPGGHGGVALDAHTNLISATRTEEEKSNSQIFVSEAPNGVVEGVTVQKMLAKLKMKQDCDVIIDQLNKQNEADRNRDDPCTKKVDDGGAVVLFDLSWELSAENDYIYELYMLNQSPHVTVTATAVDISGIDVGSWVSISFGPVSDYVRVAVIDRNIIEPWKSTFQFSNEVPIIATTAVIDNSLPRKPKDSSPSNPLGLGAVNPPDPVDVPEGFICLDSAKTTFELVTDQLNNLIAMHDQSQQTAQQVADAYGELAGLSEDIQLIQAYSNAANAWKEYASALEAEGGVMSKAWTDYQAKFGTHIDSAITGAATVTAGMATCDPGALQDAAAALPDLADDVSNLDDVNRGVQTLTNNANNNAIKNNELMKGAMDRSCESTAVYHTVKTEVIKDLTSACGPGQDIVLEMVYVVYEKINKTKDAWTSIPIQANILDDTANTLNDEIKCTIRAVNAAQIVLPQSMANCSDQPAPPPPDPGDTPTAQPSTDCLDIAEQAMQQIQTALTTVNTYIGKASDSFDTFALAYKAASDIADQAKFANPYPVDSRWTIIPKYFDYLKTQTAQISQGASAVVLDLEAIRAANPDVQPGTSEKVNALDPTNAKTIADAATAALKLQDIRDRLQTDCANLVAAETNTATQYNVLLQSVADAIALVQMFAQTIGGFSTDDAASQTGILAALIKVPDITRSIEFALDGMVSPQLTYIGRLLAQGLPSSDCVDAHAATDTSDVNQQRQDSVQAQNSWAARSTWIDQNPDAIASAIPDYSPTVGQDGRFTPQLWVHDGPPPDARVNPGDVWVDTSVELTPPTSGGG